MKENAQVAQNKEDTRDHVARIATHLFSMQGYDATSIRDISQEAGVTKPVLYYYFQSKENLFTTLIQEAYAFLYESLQAIVEGPGDFWNRLRKLTHFYFEAGQEFGDTCRLLYMVAYGPRKVLPEIDIFELEKKHFEYLGRLFQEGKEQGIVRESQMETIVQFYLGTVSIYMQTLLFTSDPLPENCEGIILDYVFHGIGGKQ